MKNQYNDYTCLEEYNNYAPTIREVRSFTKNKFDKLMEIIANINKLDGYEKYKFFLIITSSEHSRKNLRFVISKTINNLDEPYQFNDDLELLLYYKQQCGDLAISDDVIESLIIVPNLSSYNCAVWIDDRLSVKWIKNLLNKNLDKMIKKDFIKKYLDDGVFQLKDIYNWSDEDFSLMQKKMWSFFDKGINRDKINSFINKISHKTIEDIDMFKRMFGFIELLDTFK